MSLESGIKVQSRTLQAWIMMHSSSNEVLIAPAPYAVSDTRIGD